MLAPDLLADARPAVSATVALTPRGEAVLAVYRLKRLLDSLDDADHYAVLEIVTAELAALDAREAQR